MKKLIGFFFIILSFVGAQALALSPDLEVEKVKFDWTGLIPIGVLIFVTVAVYRYWKKNIDH